MHILIVGKTGTGKTALANALLSNESAGGTVSFGANPGTRELVTHLFSTQNGITTHLYHIRGLCDGTGIENERNYTSCEKEMPN